MDFLINLYTTLDTQLESAPESYGLFHVACILAVALLTFLVCKLFKDSSDRAVNVLTASVWVVILVLEIYKQLIHGFYIEDGVFHWDYAWYIFPFQFCSSPLYIFPIIAFSSNEKLRQRCIAYMMTFSLFAGLAVFCYPNDVFVVTTGINYQTMIHHGSQILMGVLYGARYRAKLSAKFFLGGVRIFVVMVFIAMLLNVGSHYLFRLTGIDETFNMFYISPYFECTLPLLNTVWSMVPYAAFVCVYFFGFILCALIVYSLFRCFTRGARPATMSRRARRLAYERDCVFYYNM